MTFKSSHGQWSMPCSASPKPTPTTASDASELIHYPRSTFPWRTDPTRKVPNTVTEDRLPWRMHCHGLMDGMTGKVPFPWRIAITHFSVTVTTDRNRLPRHDGVKRQENFPCRLQDRQGKFKILPSFTYRQGCLKLSVSALTVRDPSNFPCRPQLPYRHSW